MVHELLVDAFGVPLVQRFYVLHFVMLPLGVCFIFMFTDLRRAAKESGVNWRTDMLLILPISVVMILFWAILNLAVLKFVDFVVWFFVIP